MILKASRVMVSGSGKLYRAKIVTDGAAIVVLGTPHEGHSCGEMGCERFLVSDNAHALLLLRLGREVEELTYGRTADWDGFFRIDCMASTERIVITGDVMPFYPSQMFPHNCQEMGCGGGTHVVAKVDFGGHYSEMRGAFLGYGD